jgi:hypothetical protein
VGVEVKKLAFSIRKAGYSFRAKSLSVNFYDARKKSTSLAIKKAGHAVSKSCMAVFVFDVLFHHF